MKTISVIFTKEKQVIPKGREYTYNTDSDVKVGDLIHIEDTKGNQQVTKIHNKLYTYYSNNGTLYEEHSLTSNVNGKIKEVICTKIE